MAQNPDGQSEVVAVLYGRSDVLSAVGRTGFVPVKFEQVGVIHLHPILSVMGGHFPFLRVLEILSEARVNGLDIHPLSNPFVETCGKVGYGSPYPKPLEVGQDYDSMKADGVHYSPAEKWYNGREGHKLILPRETKALSV